eukprot:8735392-Prorocentrum_lima.AAC.1
MALWSPALKQEEPCKAEPHQPALACSQAVMLFFLMDIGSSEADRPVTPSVFLLFPNCTRRLSSTWA